MVVYVVLHLVVDWWWVGGGCAAAISAAMDGGLVVFTDDWVSRCSLQFVFVGSALTVPSTRCYNVSFLQDTGRSRVQHAH